MPRIAESPPCRLATDKPSLALALESSLSLLLGRAGLDWMALENLMAPTDPSSSLQITSWGLAGIGKFGGTPSPIVQAPAANQEAQNRPTTDVLQNCLMRPFSPFTLPPSLPHCPCAPAVPLLSHAADGGRFSAWNVQPPGKPIQLYFGPHAALHYLVCTSVLRASRETLIPDHDSYPQRYHASRRTPRSCRPVVRGAGAAQRGLDPPDVNGLRNIHGSPDDCCLSH
jgi:hypothetical protein